MSQRALFRSFAGGEITPELLGRLDLGKFQTGLARCRNFVTLPHGPASRRRGFRYIAEAATSTKATRLIPFAYSAEQTAVLEFGHLTVRFFVNGEVVLEASKACTATGSTVSCASHGYATGDDVFIGGRFVRVTVTGSGTYTAADRWGNAVTLTGATSCARVYTLETPYVAADLFGIHYAQDSDVLTLVHPSYQARELRRLGAASWSLDVISFAPSATVPTGVGVTPTIGTAGNESPQNYCVTAIGADGITESLPSLVVSTSNNLSVAGNYNTLAWSAVSGATGYNVYKSRGGAFGYIGQTTSLSIVDDNVLPDTAKTPPQNVYTLNADPDTYPSAVTYHEQRRWFAGSNAGPQNVWATRNGTQSNLTSSVPSQDDDGMQFRIQARQQNAIRHLVPLSDLIALTVGGEFRLFADNAPAITPSTLSIKPQGASGASNVQPALTSGSILYVQSQGSRVREMAYNWQNNAYASIDISIMAPHLFDGRTVVDMAYVRAPMPSLWCVRSDGTLLGMTYVPEQQVYGWHRHDTPGRFESVCVVSEGLEDALYAVVQRTINDRPVRYIERLESAYYVEAVADTEPAPVYFDALMANDTLVTVPAHAAGDMIIVIRRGGFSGDGPPALLPGFTNIITGTATFPYSARAQYITDTDNTVTSVSNSAGVTCQFLIISGGGSVGAAGHLNSESSASPIAFPDLALTVDDGSSSVVGVVLMNQQRTIANPAGMDLMLQNYTPTNFGGGEFSSWIMEGATEFAGVETTFSGGGAYWHTIAFEILPPGSSGGGGGEEESSTDLDRNDFYVDSGLTYRGEAADEITGLHHLEGETVQILADGAVHPTRTVTGGAITLQGEYSLVHIGLGYESDLITLPVTLEAAASGQGLQKNVNGVRIKAATSSAIKAGPSFAKLTRNDDRNVSDPYDSPPSLRTTEFRFAIGPSWNPDGQVCIRQDLPLPATILSMAIDVAAGG
jgi:hypothetical protein